MNRFLVCTVASILPAIASAQCGPIAYFIQTGSGEIRQTTCYFNTDTLEWTLRYEVENYSRTFPVFATFLCTEANVRIAEFSVRGLRPSGSSSASYVSAALRPQSFPSDSIRYVRQFLGDRLVSEVALRMDDVGQFGLSEAEPGLAQASSLLIHLGNINSNIGYTSNAFGTFSAIGTNPDEFTQLTGAGVFRGDAVCLHGEIGRISFAGGISGLNDGRSLISAPKKIREVLGSSINADIETTDPTSDHSIYSIIASNGNITGSISTGRLARGSKIDNTGTADGRISASGNIDADIFFLYNLPDVGGSFAEISAGGSFAAGRRLWISNATAANTAITVGSGGLQGQVIINGDNDNYAWSGSVSVNGTTLTPVPAYSAASSTVGGGAVGLVPFRYYAADTATALTQGNFNLGGSVANPPGLQLGFYGPVWASSSVPLPCAVYLRTPSNVEILMNNSIVETIDRSGSNGVYSRVLKITSTTARPLLPNPSGYTYVARITGDVLCDLGNGTSIPAPTTDIEFSIIADCDGDGIADSLDGEDPCEGNYRWGFCSADMNFDGFLDFFDNDDYLAAFEAGSPAADFTGDGFIDFFDYDEFLAAFQAGCGS